MPNVAPIQSSFRYGEISPKQTGDVNSEAYREGLAFCENFEITPQGSAELRNGFEHITQLTEGRAVIHTFKRDIGNDVIVVIGDTQVQLFDRSGLLGLANYGNYITDPGFENGFSEWDYFGLNGSAQVVPGVGFRAYAIFNDPDVAAVSMSQEFNVDVPGDSHKASAVIVLHGVAGKLLKGDVSISVRDATTNAVLGSVDKFYDNYIAGQSETLEFNFAPPASGFVKFSVVTTCAYANSGIYATFSEISVTNDTQPFVPAQWPVPASWEGRLNSLQSCVDSALGRMFFTVFDGDMYELSYDRDLADWTFEAFAPIPPAADPDNPWVVEKPSCCTIHQGRLWLAATPSKRSTIWASKSSNYDDFTVGANPDDGLEFTLASSGAIQWIEGLKNLLIGTDLGEVIGRSQGAVITPSDFSFPLEQTWGSSRLQPPEVADQVLFITPDGRKVRNLFDNGDITNGYGSGEVSFNSDHLLAPKVVDLCYNKNPNYQLNTALSDGTLASATFWHALQINGWYRVSTQGNFKSITSSSEDTGTSLWAVVERLVDGALVLSLEVKLAESVTPYNVDNYTLKEVPVDNIITGLEHLEGAEVQIIVLDNVEEEQTYSLHEPLVVTGGQVTLDDWVTSGTALIGLGFTGKFTTLKLEGSNPAGTAQVQKRRFKQIFARIYNSAIPLINGDRPYIRTPAAPMTRSQPLMTGDVMVEDAGYNDGVITIEQDKPLPTKIAAVFGQAKGSSV